MRSDHEHETGEYLSKIAANRRPIPETAPLTRTTFWRGNYENDPSLRTGFFVACGLHPFEPDTP